MNIIVTGNFRGADAAREALVALCGVGFGSGQIASFDFAGRDPMVTPSAGALGHDAAVDSVMSGVAAGSAVGAMVGQVDMLIAVQVHAPGRRDTAIRVLREHGASDIEVPDGTLVDGRSIDFDRCLSLRLLAP